VIEAEQIGGAHHEHVEVHEVPLCEEIDVAPVPCVIALIDLGSVDEPKCRERLESLLVPAGGNTDAAEHAELIIFIRDSESWLEASVLREFAQQLGAECVNRPALCLGRSRAEEFLESRGDFSCRFIRECERADSRWLDAFLLDQVSDALDQAECFSRAGASENENRSGLSLDCGELGWRRRVRGKAFLICRDDWPHLHHRLAFLRVLLLSANLMNGADYAMLERSANQMREYWREDPEQWRAISYQH